MTAIPVLPSHGQEARLFWRLRSTILRKVLTHALQRARLRSSMVLLLTGVFWAGMFGVFHEGFRLMRMMISHAGTRADTVHAIFNVFFLSLMIMITLSSAILLYSGLYRSREAAFLLTRPVREERIVLFKFHETLLISCWGFFLLGSPLLVAYGTSVGAPWYYYVAFLPFMLAFSLIPVSLGGILCVLVVRYLAPLRKQALLAAALACTAIIGGLAWTVLAQADREHAMSIEWFQGTLNRLQYSEQRWLPSWWLSTGLLEAAHPASARQQQSWRESLGFFSSLLSTALMLNLALAAVARWHYAAGYSGLAEHSSIRQRVIPFSSDVWLTWWTYPLPASMRLLLVKDLRIFRRDVLQWSQFAIFFGLLTFYFLNIRRLQYGDAIAGWMMVVGYLNVGVVGLLLATFTTRFIYPLISLEGRRFWILATLPIGRRDILWSKFIFACGISLLPCAVLILLSDLVLQIQRQSVLVVVLHQFTCAILCLGLSGIAVGLGARLPNLQDSSPAKIASGFGGTLTLVLSVLFILLTVMATAVPTCWWLSAGGHGLSSLADPGSFHLGGLGLVAAGVMATIILGLVATIVPLTMGLRWFEWLEP